MKRSHIVALLGGLGAVGLALAVVALRAGLPRPSRSAERDARPAVARDQLFFAGPGLVAVFVLQRTGAALVRVEVKGFVERDGHWEPPLYESVVLRRWPGWQPQAALAAWQHARRGLPLRVRWSARGSGLSFEVRTAGARWRLHIADLHDGGEGDDPYGTVCWRYGHAVLEVNGQPLRGIGVWERLCQPRTAWPRLGEFEMWWVRDAAGRAVLARVGGPAAGEGTAVVFRAEGPPERRPWTPVPVESREDAPTGFRLPRAWRLPAWWVRPGGAVLRRTGGDIGRGQAPPPAGGPAVYDIGAVRGPGGASGLVFHLQDTPGAARVRR